MNDEELRDYLKRFCFGREHLICSRDLVRQKNLRESDLRKKVTGEEVIPDPDADVEENILHALAVQRVREVVDALPEEDATLLRALYLQTPPLTLRAYSEKTGIPVMTLHYRKEKLLRLLKQQI